MHSTAQEKQKGVFVQGNGAAHRPLRLCERSRGQSVRYLRWGTFEGYRYSHDSYSSSWWGAKLCDGGSSNVCFVRSNLTRRDAHSVDHGPFDIIRKMMRDKPVSRPLTTSRRRCRLTCGSCYSRVPVGNACVCRTSAPQTTPQAEGIRSCTLFW